MEYKYSLAKLQDNKEDIEKLITRQSQRVGPVFPQNLEQEFWTKNLERARKHVEKYVWGGVLAYFIFLVVIIPTDYWIISKEHFVHDFVLCMLGLINGCIALTLFYMFSCLPKIRRFFPQASMLLVFWMLVSISCITMSIKTPALQHQSMAIVTIIYILGYVLTGIKPVQMLVTGLAAAATTIIALSIMSIEFSPLVFGRILIGSCLLGYVISHMIFARERVIFLYSIRARISEQIQRIHTTELLHLSHQKSPRSRQSPKMFFHPPRAPKSKF